MNMRFTERKASVPPETKAYAEKKCGKLEKYFDGDAALNVIFSLEREKKIVEITVQNHGMFFRAQEQTSDFSASVDGAIESIERQIRKNKTRLEKKLRSEAFSQAEPIAPDAEESFELVRIKPLTVKPMTVDDAILQMNLLGHQFYFFVNSDEKNAHCVVYKRNNGGYGLLISDR